MFHVVAEVEQYPQFLPWVLALRVLSREPAGPCEIVTAEMAVGYGALREKYTSRVELDPIARRVDVAQTTGPFKVLENHWRFTPTGTGSRVEFSIAYEFKSRLLNAVAGAAFGMAYARMADAFEARAKVLSDQAVQKI
jgi:coenzyme Q-binding protein COQ10